MRSFFSQIKRRLLVNSSRIYLERYNREFAQTMKPGQRVLDAGAGDAPYKMLFNKQQYETADFDKVEKHYAPSTYTCDICEHIPVEDRRFDYIVFNQTMEHVKEPARALAELYRVLVPDGRMLCTVPLFYEEHETPFDFFRYTQFGHRYLFTNAGFQIERIEWLEGFFGTCGYMFQAMSKYLPLRLRGSPIASLLVSPFLFVVKLFSLFAAAIFYRLDIRWKVTHLGFPKNYVIVARKPI